MGGEELTHSNAMSWHERWREAVGRVSTLVGMGAILEAVGRSQGVEHAQRARLRQREARAERLGSVGAKIAKRRVLQRLSESRGGQAPSHHPTLASHRPRYM